MRRVYALGETVLDMIFKNGQPVAAKAGGSCLNSAVSMARTGLNVSFVGECGKDQAGSLIYNLLEENNIGLSHFYMHADGKSNLAMAFLNEKNDAEYDFYKIPPKERLKIDPPDFQENDILLFGSFYAITPQVRPQVKKILDRAKKNKAIIVYDPNFRKSHADDLPALKDIILENIEIADIIRTSNEDMENIFGTGDVESAFEILKDKALVFYTSSSKKVDVWNNRKIHTFPIPAIKVKSAIGAGDNFNAGMIYALIKNYIGLSDLKNLSPEIIQNCTETAILFAAAVCQSYDNYVPEGFDA